MLKYRQKYFCSNRLLICCIFSYNDLESRRLALTAGWSIFMLTHFFCFDSLSFHVFPLLWRNWLFRIEFNILINSLYIFVLYHGLSAGKRPLPLPDYYHWLKLNQQQWQERHARVKRSEVLNLLSHSPGGSPYTQCRRKMSDTSDISDGYSVGRNVWWAISQICIEHIYSPSDKYLMNHESFLPTLYTWTTSCAVSLLLLCGYRHFCLSWIFSGFHRHRET